MSDHGSRDSNSDGEANHRQYQVGIYGDGGTSEEREGKATVIDPLPKRISFTTVTDTSRVREVILNGKRFIPSALIPPEPGDDSEGSTEKP